MRSPIKYLSALGVGLLAAATVATTGCNSRTDRVYNDNIRTREEVFEQAQSRYPMPVPRDFPLRRDLVEYTKRQANPGPWYIYIQSDLGTYTSYYVSKNLPQNACNFLSDTKTYVNGYPHDAPSLDGVYYGGTGASGACDSWFWFDAATDALVMTRFKFTLSDQPLLLDVPQITVQIKK